MSDLFGHRPLKAVVTEAREALGGRANRDELVEAVKSRLTLSEYEAWLVGAFRQAVFSTAKSRVGLLGDDAVYGVGDDIAPLRLFSVAELTAKARELARLSTANKRAVYALAAICQEVHGLSFDAEAIIAEEAA